MLCRVMVRVRDISVPIVVRPVAASVPKGSGSVEKTKIHQNEPIQTALALPKTRFLSFHNRSNPNPDPRPPAFPSLTIQGRFARRAGMPSCLCLDFWTFLCAFLPRCLVGSLPAFGRLDFSMLPWPQVAGMCNHDRTKLHLATRNEHGPLRHPPDFRPRRIAQGPH